MSLKSLSALEPASGQTTAAIEAFRSLGPLARTLCASRAQGLVLELGGGHGLLTAWLQNGLHADVPLVVIDEDKHVLACTQAALPADLRIAFHAENLDVFVSDMADKRFDLIVDHRDHTTSTDLTETLQLLPSGGLWLTRWDATPAHLGSEFKINTLSEGWVLVARGMPAPTRRGGRRTRVAVDEPQV